MVVSADDGANVVAGGDAVLVQNENAVGNTVREFRLLRVKVGKSADALGLGVIRNEVARVDVPAGGHDDGAAAAEIERNIPKVEPCVFNRAYLRRDDGAEYLVAGLDIRGDGGLILIQRVVIV